MTKFKSILLIDDDDDYLYLVKKSLEKHNLYETVQVTTNANDGLNYLQEICNEDVAGNCPDIVFVDNHMPDMNGETFLEKINEIGRRANNNLLIYLVSALASEKDMEMLKKYKITGFINKPLTAAKVKELLLNI
jgi:CheY-like chemotaxis protein